MIVLIQIANEIIDDIIIKGFYFVVVAFPFWGVACKVGSYTPFTETLSPLFRLIWNLCADWFWPVSRPLDFSFVINLFFSEIRILNACVHTDRLDLGFLFH